MDADQGWLPDLDLDLEIAMGLYTPTVQVPTEPSEDWELT